MLNISTFAEAEFAVAVSPPTVPAVSGPLSPVSEVIRPPPVPVALNRDTRPAGGASAVVADDFSPQ